MAMTELAAAMRREPDPCGLNGWLWLVFAAVLAGLAWNLFVLKETTALFTGAEAEAFFATADPALYQLTMLEIFVSGCLILANHRPDRHFLHAPPPVSGRLHHGRAVLGRMDHRRRPALPLDRAGRPG